MRFVVLFLLASIAAAQCEKNSWVIEDDGLAGIVSKDGRLVKIATVHLLSPDHEYTAVTYSDGSFSIWPVPTGKYTFAAKGWGEGEVEMQSWHHHRVHRSSTKGRQYSPARFL
jgi:hypothetical protein